MLGFNFSVGCNSGNFAGALPGFRIPIKSRSFIPEMERFAFIFRVKVAHLQSELVELTAV